MSSLLNERPEQVEHRPRITLTADDHRRLSSLARAATDRMPAAAWQLEEELDRAHVLVRGHSSNGVVRMGSEVEFRDDASGKVNALTLVYPHEADIAQRKISVLTPVGTALVGLPVGASITWRTRLGEAKRLTVLQISEPERV